MTREELIEGLKLLEDNMVYFDELLNDKGKRIDVHELLFESIEALEQEPCEDCISRKALIEYANNLKEGIGITANDIARFPSVKPTTKENLVVEDCISREEVCDYIAEFVNHEYATDRERELVKHIIGGIQHLPSIQPKTGHWIATEKDWWKCSECGQVIYSETEQDRREYHAYCGRCGAKMLPTNSKKGVRI